MATDVVMPQMGESIFEGTITKWLKKPGDKVERDEPLFEISTDKVDAEIPSPSAGVLKEIKIPEGQTVPIQTVVAVIDGAGSAAVRSGSRPCCGETRAGCRSGSGCRCARKARACRSSCGSGNSRSCRRCCRTRGWRNGHRTHSLFAAGPPHGQGTWHRPHLARRLRRRWPHHQGRHRIGNRRAIRCRQLLPLYLRLRLLPRVPRRHLRRLRSPLPVLPQFMAASTFPRFSSAFPASASISAATKFSRSASCARKLPSTWWPPSMFRRTSIPSTKST